MAGCEKAFVHVGEVHVLQAEQFGPGYEPGAAAEWRLTFTVGGHSFTYANDHVKNGSILPINRDFTVDISSGRNLTIDVSGEEVDDTSAHDWIPRASLTLTPAQVASGPSEHRLQAGNVEFSYSVFVNVRCDTRGVLNETSKSGPAVALFKNDIYIAWVGVPHQQINVMNLRTLEKVTLEEWGVGGAALTVLGDRLFLAWTDTAPRYQLNLMSSSDGQVFENKVPLPYKSIDRPALAVSRNLLYLSWTSFEGVGDITILHSSDGQENFSIPTRLSETSFTGPSLVGNNYGVSLGWVERTVVPGILGKRAVRVGESRIYLMGSADGENFGHVQPLPETSDSAPSLAYYEDAVGTPSTLYLMWTGTGNQNLNHVHAILAEKWEGKRTLGERSIAAPALLSRPGRLDCFWAADDGEGHLSYMTIA